MAKYGEACGNERLAALANACLKKKYFFGARASIFHLRAWRLDGGPVTRPTSGHWGRLQHQVHRRLCSYSAKPTRRPALFREFGYPLTLAAVRRQSAGSGTMTGLKDRSASLPPRLDFNHPMKCSRIAAMIFWLTSVGRATVLAQIGARNREFLRVILQAQSQAKTFAASAPADPAPGLIAHSQRRAQHRISQYIGIVLHLISDLFSCWRCCWCHGSR